MLQTSNPRFNLLPAAIIQGGQHTLHSFKFKVLATLKFSDVQSPPPLKLLPWIAEYPLCTQFPQPSTISDQKPSVNHI